MKVVVAIDSYKGCLSSQEANHAAADGIRGAQPDAEVVEVAVSDGGEGFLDAMHSAIGGEWIRLSVSDPLMRRITARYLLRGDTAVVEIAQASGLTLLAETERNPMVATSFGTGEMVADALRRGAKHIIVGLGGSGTSDAGIGMLRALDEAALDVAGAKFTIASDVKNPLYGQNGAAHVFAAQKGATKEQILLLDERARTFAAESARRFGFDRSGDAGAGAAGGLGYAFMQYLGAECRSGIELLLATIGFDGMVRDADIVITGEGSADRQTLMGKLPMGILRHSGHTPVCLIAGRVDDSELLLQAGFAHVECINPKGLPLEDAMRKDVAQRNIRRTVERLLAHAVHQRWHHL